MRSNSIENRYISNLETPKSENLGFEAEEVVVKFFQTIPGMDIRFSSGAEDSGRDQIVKDQQLDAIAYLEGKPAMGLQITTAADPKIRAEKMKQVMARPFIRLPEMKTSDTAIPRVLIYVDPKEIKSFESDGDFEKHPTLANQILNGATKSLQADISLTKNPLEQKAIQQLMGMLEQEKRKGSVH